MGKSSPQEAKNRLSPLHTDRVVVESAADVQGLLADRWAGAAKKQRLWFGSRPGSAGHKGLCNPGKVASCLWSTIPLQVRFSSPTSATA